MMHYFNTKLAEKYGIEEAIIINHLYFWISKNKANGSNLREGHYWTYNSARAFAGLFPYMNQSKVSRILNHLVKDGVILKGNFNEQKYDRTSWYAFSDTGWAELVENGYDNIEECILQKCKMDDNDLQNGFNKNVEPIPYINQIKKQDNNIEEVTAEPTPTPTETNLFDSVNTEPAKEKSSAKRERFKKPTLEEVQAYCKEKGYGLDAEYFWNYYESIGWKRGKMPIVSWQRTLATWNKKEKENGNNTRAAGQDTCGNTKWYSKEHHEYNFESDFQQ